MYINIEGNNIEKGTSCADLISYEEKEQTLSKEFANYLDKENSLEVDYFFNETQQRYEKDQVIDSIDNNRKHISKSEHNYYKMVINPSAKEIAYLEDQMNDTIKKLQLLRSDFYGTDMLDTEQLRETIMKDLLRDYTRDCMDRYAQNFCRDNINSSSDLVWFGKVEKNRYWKPRDKNVMHNRKLSTQIKRAERKGDIDLVNALRKDYILECDVLPGGQSKPIEAWMPKSGKNYHVHVIVSRNNKGQTSKLSPLSKSRTHGNHSINGRKCKIGFDRDKFDQACESIFDNKFGYERDFTERYEMRKFLVKDHEKYAELAKNETKKYEERYFKIKEIISSHKISNSIEDELIKNGIKLSNKEANYWSNYVDKASDKIEFKRSIIVKQQLKQAISTNKDLNSSLEKSAISYLRRSVIPHNKFISLGEKTLNVKNKDQALQLAEKLTQNFLKLSGMPMAAINPYLMGAKVVKGIADKVVKISTSSKGMDYE